MVQVRVFDRNGKLVGPIETPHLDLSTAEWERRLTKDQFQILRAQGTERAFCGTLLDNHKEGVYACAGCGLPLFASDAKFNSGTGWPSFFQPIARENVIEHQDQSHGMARSEILCPVAAATWDTSSTTVRAPRDCGSASIRIAEVR